MNYLHIISYACSLSGLMLIGIALWRARRLHSSQDNVADGDLPSEAQKIVTRLRTWEREYRHVALEVYTLVEQGDEETAKLALEVFGHRNRAALWFGDRVESLGNKTPWECLAEGRVEDVRRILNSIIYGVLA